VNTIVSLLGWAAWLLGLPTCAHCGSPFGLRLVTRAPGDTPLRLCRRCAPEYLSWWAARRAEAEARRAAEARQ